MFFHQIWMESIVTCRHRRMRRENHFPRHAANGFIKADPLIFHPGSNRFENSERAVAFVEMKNSRSDSHGAQGTEISDSKQEFLPNPYGSGAAIDAGSAVTVFWQITGQIRIDKNDVTPV